MAVYLITGGAGFIGSHLAEALVKRGETVRIVDNFITGSRANIAHLIDKIELYEQDIADLDGMQRAMRGVDYVLHQAALPSVPRSVADPLGVHAACTTGTLNVLIAARDNKVKRVVYAASSSAYGDIDGEYKIETMPTRPLSPYAVAKLAGEQYCQVFYTCYGLETVALRYFNVFGPRQDPFSPYSAVIPLFIKSMLEDKAPTIFGDGLQTRDFTYIDNVVHGNLLACHADPAVAGEMMNLACGDKISLLDLITALNQQLGKHITPNFAPARAGDVRHSRADIGKAGRLLGYEPVVSLDKGLEHTIAWLREESTAS